MFLLKGIIALVNIMKSTIPGSQMTGNISAIFTIRMKWPAIQTAAGHFHLLDEAIFFDLDLFGHTLSGISGIIGLTMTENVIVSVDFNQRSVIVAGIADPVFFFHNADVAVVMQDAPIGKRTDRTLPGRIAQLMTVHGRIDEEVKALRRNEIMELQQEISLDKNLEFVDKVLDVIVEGYLPDEEVYTGRSYRDAPGVDGLVFIDSDRELMSGAIVKVRILEADNYDMTGVLAD